MDIQEYKEIMERLDFIEFRQDLILCTENFKN